MRRRRLQALLPTPKTSKISKLGKNIDSALHNIREAAIALYNIILYYYIIREAAIALDKKPDTLHTCL